MTASTADRPLRWGFLSTARIGGKNWRAALASGRNVVTAVASRDHARAAAFIAEHQAAAPMPQRPHACGSYEELIARPDVDAVYLPLPTALRGEWIVKAAQAGKHVLCEKPCAVDATQLAAQIDACARHGVQFLDGVMFMHHPRLAVLRPLLSASGPLGDLRRVQSHFSFAGAPDFATANIRAQAALEPAGCLGDLGWYNLRFTLWAFDWRLPARVTGLIHSAAADATVPFEFSGELLYPGGVSAGFYCSFRSPAQQWAHCSGTQGSLRLDDFVHAKDPAAARYLLDGREVVTPCATDGLPGAGHDARMFRNFAAQVASGTLNAEWPRWALLTQRVMDACHRSALAGGAPVAVEA